MTRQGVLAVYAVVLLGTVATSTYAFAPTRAFASSSKHVPSFKAPTIELSAASASKSDEQSKKEDQITYPALSNEEVEKFLSRIPVYAVTDSASGGVVLMSERSAAGDAGDTSKGIAYIFITKEAATATMKQLKGSSPGANWDVTGLSLGAIWYELISGDATVHTQSVESGETLDTSDEKVEYRLVPDYRDVNGARDLLSQSPEAKEALEKSGAFSSAYGDVPVFMDLQIRMEEQQNDGSTVEKFPMYLALQDMVETCQQFLDAQSGTYEAAINVAQLKNLVEQMQQPGTVDFRKAVLIPPTPIPMPEKPKPLGIKGLDDEEDGDSDAYSPSMNDGWSGDSRY